MYLFVQFSEGQTKADYHNNLLQRTTSEAAELSRPANPRRWEGEKLRLQDRAWSDLQEEFHWRQHGLRADQSDQAYEGLRNGSDSLEQP